MTGDYCKLDQVMIPIAAVVSLFEHMNISPGTWYAAIDLANGSFYPYLSVRMTRISLLSTDKASNIPSLSYLRGISALQYLL